MDAVGAKSSTTSSASFRTKARASNALAVLDQDPGRCLASIAEPKCCCTRAATSLFPTPVGPTLLSSGEDHFEKANRGLLPTPVGRDYWNFYEWATGLDGCKNGDCTAFAVLESTRYDAPYNLFFILALDAASTLASALRDNDCSAIYKEVADQLRAEVHKTFWSNGSYLTYSDDKRHRCEFVQALAIIAEVCPDMLRNRLASDDNGLVKTTLSHCLYKFEALLGDADRYAKTVFGQIARDWGHMLMAGASTFWETLNGSSDFAGAGSLCHGWSAIPVYFYHRYSPGE